jgi:gluconate 2-dehydrogenase gamma chain
MDRDESQTTPTRISRLGFLRGAGAVALGAGLAGCGEEADEAARPAVAVDAPQYEPLPPDRLPLNCDVRAFFGAEESAAVEALTATLIPGDADDPGAREACVTSYIDQKLARFDSFAAPTYFRPPFAKPVEGPAPADQRSQTTIRVAKDELERYGFQSSLTPQEAYRKGLAQLDRHVRRRYGRSFADLDAATQEEVVAALEADDVAGFEEPTAKGFFTMLQADANEGMFADPAYGGNRGFAGWRLIGYPGIQRAWTPDELRNGPRRRRIQGLGGLSPLHAGHPDPRVILPLAGSRRGAR